MTIDKSRPPSEQRRPLPAFDPVPRQCIRHDGWTPERQRGFIEALADTGSVKAAARSVNMTPEGAYLLRRHPQGESFRAAWEAALALGVQRLEDVGLERALYGVEVPVYSYGKLIGARTVFNDRLLMFYLRNRARDRFAADGRGGGLDAASRGTLARLKREWRNEWEREAGLSAGEDDARARAEIDEMLDQMIENHRANAALLLEDATEPAEEHAGDEQ